VIEEGRRILKFDSTLSVIPWMIGFAHLRLGQPGQATSEFETALTMESPTRPASYLAALGLAYGLAGQQTRALRVLAELDSMSRNRYVSPYFLAAVCSGLGRMDDAYLHLEKALEQRTPWLVLCTPTEPLSVALRRDRRWKLFIDRLRNLVRLPEGTPDPYSSAVVSGDTTRALTLLEKLIPEPGFRLTVLRLRLDPLCNPLGNSPRFQALLAKGDRM
jgi:tetratricopeptide (TPR) repeat protein